MKTLIKLAMGAAIAGVLVNLLMKRQSRGVELPATRENAGDTPATPGFTVQELVEENVEWGGGSSGLNS